MYSSGERRHGPPGRGTAPLLFVLTWGLLVSTAALNNTLDNSLTYAKDYKDEVGWLVRRWAPVVWLAPGERFMPSAVQDFLEHASPVETSSGAQYRRGALPTGPRSQTWYLQPDTPIDQLLANKSSFLYGRNPQYTPVPVYAVIRRCGARLPAAASNAVDGPQAAPGAHFHVTYWFFYPYSEGKDVCTLNLSFLGPVPIPQIFNKCLGKQRTYGNHLGDWEHISLSFTGDQHSNKQFARYPQAMYVSTHDAGVYYTYDSRANVFAYSHQETRKGILQKPNFPKFVQVKEGHPVLFSAKGSHGLWSTPGVHRFVRIPRLLDTSGFGTAWETWRHLELVDFPYLKPRWLHFQGRWGPPKANCHPLKKLGVDVCEFNDGPAGIPLKRLDFMCPKN